MGEGGGVGGRGGEGGVGGEGWRGRGREEVGRQHSGSWKQCMTTVVRVEGFLFLLIYWRIMHITLVHMLDYCADIGLKQGT